jgi:hypothetical protein
MGDFEQIIGYEQVVSYFGEWPDFNDCTIASVHLCERTVVSDSGFRVEIAIETPDNWLCRGVRVPRAEVKLLMDGVKSFEMSDYSYQNVIGELRVKSFRDGDGIAHLRISVLPEVGASLEGSCEMLVVESVAELPR